MGITSRLSNQLLAGVAAAAVVTIATAAVGARGPRVQEHAAGAPQAPQRLAETGLYVPGTLEIAPRNRSYSPQYPLWSDGAAKARWVQVPEGATIDVSRIDAWEFPVGTKFWKEFAFEGRRVETRFLWKTTHESWVFASYAWNEEQTDATLAPSDRGMPRAFQSADGTRHDIPSVSDCRSCHDSDRTEILGFTALQLSTDRDLNAPHAEPIAPGMVTLRTLVEERMLRPPRADLLSTPPRIPGDPVTRSALGYLSANCGHCHNPAGSLATIGLFLKHSSAARTCQEEPAARSAIGKPSRWQIPGVPDDATRLIDPGAPGSSAILQRMRSRRASSQMPPLGTSRADDEAVELVERWIGAALATRTACRLPTRSPGSTTSGQR
jgi:hypothetical protein